MDFNPSEGLDGLSYDDLKEMLITRQSRMIVLVGKLMISGHPLADEMVEALSSYMAVIHRVIVSVSEATAQMMIDSIKHSMNAVGETKTEQPPTDIDAQSGDR